MVDGAINGTMNYVYKQLERNSNHGNVDHLRLLHKITVYAYEQLERDIRTWCHALTRPSTNLLI